MPWVVSPLPLPQLWSTIRIVYNKEALLRHKVIHRQVSILSMLLDRAKLQPLNVSIYLDAVIPPTNALLAILFSTSSRWENLFLYILPSACSLLRPLRAALPSLSKLGLWLVKSGSETTATLLDPSTASALSHALEFTPNLDSLATDAHMVARTAIQCKSVSVYQNGGPTSFQMFRDNLQKMPNLTYCSVSQRVSYPGGQQAVPVCHDTLRELSFDVSAAVAAGALITPSLEVLIIKGAAPRNTLVSFFCNSQFNLHKLDLLDSEFDPTECVELMKRLSGLKSLQVGVQPALDISALLDTSIGSELTYLRLRTINENMQYDDAAVNEVRESRPQLALLLGKQTFAALKRDIE
ncbi:hypothetical protein C8J56DRAFT_957534 [Mycena floridula]|nr:hypothetical protein C8J56DRAFT_957534 [Mycena floridula]